MKSETLNAISRILDENPDIARILCDDKSMFLLPNDYIYDESEKLKWFRNHVYDCDHTAIVKLDGTSCTHGTYYNHYIATLKNGWTLTTVCATENQKGE